MTICSTSRTDNPSAIILFTMVFWSLSLPHESNARACPADISSFCTFCIIYSGSVSKRRVFAMALLLFPNCCDTDSCVMLYFSISFFMPYAVSIGFKSSLWRFSISDISATFLSVKSLTNAGMWLSPARRAARHLLSPATIIYLEFFCTTKMGCNNPCSLIEDESSSMPVSSKFFLG